MKVELATPFSADRAPDLLFKGAHDREFVVFFAPLSTSEGAAMQASYDDYHSPFESTVLSEEEELNVKVPSGS
jgi:hypothetical protein